MSDFMPSPSLFGCIFFLEATIAKRGAHASGNEHVSVYFTLPRGPRSKCRAPRTRCHSPPKNFNSPMTRASQEKPHGLGVDGPCRPRSGGKQPLRDINTDRDNVS